jgi:hypothetical protein
VNCASVDLMFLSFYCDYIVDEFVVIFCISNFFSLKLLIFGGLSGSPKIRSTIIGRSLFSAARGQATENRLFSAIRCQPRESQLLFSVVVLLAAENKLFLAAGLWPPKI